MKRKTLYNDIVDVFPVPLYGAMYCGGPGQDVLKKCEKIASTARGEVFFLSATYGNIINPDVQEKRGHFVQRGTEWFSCKSPEMMDHVFLHCWEGVSFWNVVQRTLWKVFPRHRHGIRHVSVDKEDGMP